MTTIKSALELGARAAVARRTEELFRASGALRDGHFQLKSGRHGDAYVEKFAVLSDPAATSELCGYWAATFGTGGRASGGVEDEQSGARVDLVAGPTTGGVILAFETGRQLGVRAIFAEEVRADDGTASRAFRRGFRIEPGERVLLVDDILTTGGSLLAMLPAVEAMGGEIVECVVLVDRSSGGTNTLTSPDTGRVYPLRSLWRLDLPTYEPGADDLPAMRRRHADPRAGEQRDRRVTDPTPASAPAPARPGGRRLIGLGAIAIAVVALVVGAVVLGGPGRQVETGIVVSVEATSLSAVQGFSIQTRDGRTVDFRIERLENATTFPPGHLAEHKVSLTPVRVTYVDRDGSHIAVMIEDAP